jgi:hypothetical protein
MTAYVTTWAFPLLAATSEQQHEPFLYLFVLTEHQC